MRKNVGKRVIVIFLSTSSIMMVANAAARKLGKCTDMITAKPLDISNEHQFLPGYLSIIEFLP